MFSYTPDTNITYLKGVGEKRAAMLNSECSVFTLGDLLYYFPYRYIDRTRYYRISEIDIQQSFIQVKGKVIAKEVAGKIPHQRLVVLFADETGVMELLWFRGIQFVNPQLIIGQEYIAFGRPGVFNGRYNMAHPEMIDAGKAARKLNFALQPLYTTTEKMKKHFLNSNALHQLADELFRVLDINTIEETLPDYLIEKYHLLPLGQSLFQLHFPQSAELLRKAEFRMKFEELFYIQVERVGSLIRRKKQSHGLVFSKVGDYFNRFYHHNLRFELTDAQKKVIRELRKDLGSGRQMNRLLQGDVGSGKTLVALMTMLLAIDNGYQACLMAPTEILAGQHYTTLTRQLEGLGLKIAFLSGSVKGKKRTQILTELENGEINILVGTHALIEETVIFKNPGLVVIDEQHRFGVAQRARLWHKNDIWPHVLVMTATPIPRTLAMTLYGDLDISIIDQMPPGRKPIVTKHFADSGRQQVYTMVKNEIASGRQAYIVFPLIKESEKLDYKNLEAGFKSLQKVFPEPGYKMVMVHGKLKPDVKEAAMQQFVSGNANILVATTVIEVGVDVPNATVMVIESAERFGLAQLHQLRGRVGRGGNQSFCFLLSSSKLSDDGRKRMLLLTQTTDGFIIAEEDLKMRGQGDIEGTRQSGDAVSLKIANLGLDGNILQMARDIAAEILEDDPNLVEDKNKAIRITLEKLHAGKVNWRLIS